MDLSGFRDVFITVLRPGLCWTQPVEGPHVNPCSIGVTSHTRRVPGAEESSSSSSSQQVSGQTASLKREVGDAGTSLSLHCAFYSLGGGGLDSTGN